MEIDLHIRIKKFCVLNMEASFPYNMEGLIIEVPLYTMCTELYVHIMCKQQGLCTLLLLIIDSS